MKNFLKEEEIKELKSKHRSEQDGKIRDRIKAVMKIIMILFFFIVCNLFFYND